MPVIDVDSHVTVTKRLEGTPFRVDILPDGGHGFEFNKAGLRFTPPGGRIPRSGKEPISVQAFWDLDRRLEDLDRDGIDRQVLIFTPPTSFTELRATPRSRQHKNIMMVWPK